MFGDVGQRLLRDAIQREADSRRNLMDRSFDAQCDVQTRSLEICYEDAHVVEMPQEVCDAASNMGMSLTCPNAPGAGGICTSTKPIGR